jgi:hypothetical protein
MLHGAACHGCLLVSETSCEARNVSLDRALLADTVATVGRHSSERGRLLIGRSKREKTKRGDDILA